MEKVDAAYCLVCIYKQKRRHLMEACFLAVAIPKEFDVLNGFNSPGQKMPNMIWQYRHLERATFHRKMR